MDLDDKPKHRNKKVMEKESYISYRRSEEEEQLLNKSINPYHRFIYFFKKK
jgi:hypothetical protein